MCTPENAYSIKFSATIFCPFFIHSLHKYVSVHLNHLDLITLILLSPPLWSRGQSSWLQIQRSGFDSWRYHIFWEVVGPLSLVSTTEELLERKSSCPGLEIREYGRRDPSRWPRSTFHAQNLALTSPISSGRSVGLVYSRNQATEFSFF
jgi:hypothetical protein